MLPLLVLAACDGPDTPPADDTAPVVDTADSSDTGQCTPRAWYPDEDQDGFGVDEGAVEACEAPDGSWAESAGDCDDADAQVNPGAEERCNLVDDDCDGAVDFQGWIPGDYDDLAHALATAPDDAHVCLAEGSFEAHHLAVERPIHLHGSGAGTVLDAQDGWMFRLARDTSFTLEDATLSGVQVSDTGGAVLALGDADVVLRRLSMPGIWTEEDTPVGGLVYAHDGVRVRIEEVEVVDLELDAGVSIYGMAVYVYGGSLEIDGLLISRGEVDGDFLSSVYAGDADRVVIRGLEVSELTLSAGHTIYAMAAYVTGDLEEGLIDHVTVRDNTITYEGGGQSQGIGMLGLYVSTGLDGGFPIDHLRVQGNTVKSPRSMRLISAAVYGEYGDRVVTNALVADNSIQSAGGRVQGFADTVGFGTTTWVNADITGNHTAGFELVQGGGFQNLSEGGVELRNVTVAFNEHDAPSVESVAWYSYDEDEGSDWHYVNVYGNLPVEAPAAKVDGAVLDLDLLSVDPDYADEQRTLSAGSALVDAGDPELLDADGSRSDVGAHGGPGGGW